MERDERDRRIRAATARDIPALLALYAQLNPSDPPIPVEKAESIFAQFHACDGNAIYVAVSNDALVATCALIVTPNLTRGGAPYALIENVVTDSHHRQQGHGRAVLHAAIDAAWRHGCYKVMLLTGSKNPATLRFYQETGFVQDKTGFQIRRPSIS